jgi:hypothetical protein
MKTNSIKQAEKFEEFIIPENHGTMSNKFIYIRRESVVDSIIFTEELVEVTNYYQDARRQVIIGPAFTFYELSKILVACGKFPIPAFRESKGDCWYIHIPTYNDITFHRTDNYAEDFGEISIWLLENKHITPDQVNKVLNEQS